MNTKSKKKDSYSAIDFDQYLKEDYGIIYIKVIALINLDVFGDQILTKHKIYDGVLIGRVVEILNDQNIREIYSLDGGIVDLLRNKNLDILLD